MPKRGSLTQLIVLATVGAMLASCSGSQSASGAFIPSAGAGQAQNLSAAAKPLMAADEHHHHHHGGDDGNSYTYTYVTSLTTDASLNLGIWGKTCDATVADAPLFQPASDASITQPSATSLNDCTRSVADGATNLYIVMVDTASSAVTAIAGPATASAGVLTFNATVNPVNVLGGHSYAFFVATQASSGGGGGDCDKGDHHRHNRDHHGDCGHHGDGHGGDDD